MAKIVEKDLRFRHLEKKVGLFVILAIVGLVGVIFFVGREKDLFTRKYTIYLSVDSGSGFMEGMPVKLSGFKIGRIKNLSLDNDARVKVAVEINRKYQRWIKKGSVARLTKEGMIGESIIEITVAPPGNTPIEEKQEIPFEKTGGLEDLAKDLKPVLQEVKGILGYINDPEGDIKKSLRNVAGLTGEMRQTRAQLDEVIMEMKQTTKEAAATMSTFKGIGEKAYPVVDNAGRLVNDAGAKVGPILGRMTTIMGNIEKMTQKLPQIADKVETILNDTKKMTASIAPKMESMVETAEDVLQDTKETVRGIKGSWPVNRMVPRKDGMELLPLDGSGSGR